MLWCTSPSGRVANQLNWSRKNNPHQPAPAKHPDMTPPPVVSQRSLRVLRQIAYTNRDRHRANTAHPQDGNVGQNKELLAPVTAPINQGVRLSVEREDRVKDLFQRWMPDPDRLRENKNLRIFSRWLANPNLWHLNRRSAAGALAVGMLMAWIPVPFQMVLAAGGAILWGVNLPIAVATVWITNPVTMPVLFYVAYYVGSRLLGLPPVEFGTSFSWHEVVQMMGTIGRPFLFGCAVMGIASSVSSYFLVQAGWRWSVRRRFRQRQARRVTSSR